MPSRCCAMFVLPFLSDLLGREGEGG